jgi:hypothetical protein
VDADPSRRVVNTVMMPSSASRARWPRPRGEGRSGGNLPGNVDGDLVEKETIEERVTPARLAGYVSDLRVRVSPVSVDAIVVGRTAVARAMTPTHTGSSHDRRQSSVGTLSDATPEVNRPGE